VYCLSPPSSLPCHCFANEKIDRLVNYKEKGSRLLVHLVDASTNAAHILKCNCMEHYGCPHEAGPHASSQAESYMAMPPPEVYYQYGSGLAAVAPVMQPMLSYDWDPTMGSIHGLTTGFQALSVDQTLYPTPYYAGPSNMGYAQQQYTNQPAYAPDAFGLPVNVSSGVIPTECREVYISNINFLVKKREMAAQISKYARPSTLEYNKTADGKFTGTAIATFESGEEATMVVRGLDKQTVKGKRLKVRIGKQQTPIIPPPMIVNGSTGYEHT
jgi:hypothetical protein